jgi:hypothetical protein
MASNESQPDHTAAPEVPTDAPVTTPTVGRREYLCEHCGTFLLRARGPLAPVTVTVPCRNRNCRLQNEVDMASAPEISPEQRQRWAEVRQRWRTRGEHAA